MEAFRQYMSGTIVTRVVYEHGLLTILLSNGWTVSISAPFTMGDAKETDGSLVESAILGAELIEFLGDDGIERLRFSTGESLSVDVSPTDTRAYEAMVVHGPSRQIIVWE